VRRVANNAPHDGLAASSLALISNAHNAAAMTQVTHTMQRSTMYISQALAQDRHLAEMQWAHQARIANQAARLRRVERIQQRAERKLLRAWQRADELRTTIETD
jgi:hypothetical protein